jgi:transcriptional antiterminator NusG
MAEAASVRKGEAVPSYLNKRNVGMESNWIEREEETTDIAENQHPKDYWYVFWVKTGYEEKAANDIRAAFPDEVTPLQLMVETFFRKQGKVKKEIHLAFPGYVFVVTEIDNGDFVQRANECAWKSKSIIRLLSYGNTNEAVLHEDERSAIECLWPDNECIESSIGFIEGDRVVVTDGPFVGRESVIKEIHPRRRQAVVEIEIMGGIRKMTIGLEIVEKLPEGSELI